MVACSIGEVTVLTGAAGLRVEGVYCCFGALSLECSIRSLPLLMSVRSGEIGAVTVTMARSYQSAAGYGRSGTVGEWWRVECTLGLRHGVKGVVAARCKIIVRQHWLLRIVPRR